MIGPPWVGSGGSRAPRDSVRGARGAARSGGGDGRTDQGRRHLRARWPVFNGLRDDFPPPRRTASASLANRRRPVRGLSILSPRRQAFPRISKLFQGNSKEIPWISKLFQGFPNFFLGRFEENQGVIGRSTRNRLFANFRLVSAATGGSPCAAERARDFHPSTNSDYRKAIVAIFRRGPRGERGAGRESPVPTARREVGRFVSGSGKPGGRNKL